MEIFDTAQGRRSSILAKLREDASVSVTDLSRQFEVSEVTIRKDLRILEGRNLLVRVHGGAMISPKPAGPAFEESHYDTKMLSHAAEKQAIGKAAAAHIEDGDTILIDAGTTSLEVVRNLDSFQNLTIITNSISVLSEVRRYNRFNVIMLGGNVRETSQSLVGPLAESNLKLFFCDKLFLGVDSFSVEDGLSTPSIEEAHTNQVMISRAKEVIAVFDSSKVNLRALAFIASVDKINTIVTDTRFPASLQAKLRAMNVVVETVQI